MHQNRVGYFLWSIATITLLLVILGVLFIYSASIAYGLEIKGDALFFLKKHILGLFIGLCVLIIIQKIPLYSIKYYTDSFFFLTFFLTSLTLLKPYQVIINGASRWITIGSWTFQPSELLKVATILYTAKLFSKKNLSLCETLWFFLIILLVAFLFLQQPDFGGLMLVMTTCFMLLFITHATLFASILTMIGTTFFGVFLIIIQPYRLQRVITFLNPWIDPQGKGFQIIQSFIALGSGGFLGNGISHSSQKLFYLPMQHTDFIFAIIGEEIGFSGCFLIILLYIFLFLYGIRLSIALKDPFCKVFVAGFTILINLQAITSIAVTCGLIPTKGVGLPFISYGMTNLICSLIMIGLIMHTTDEFLLQYERKYNF